MDEFGVTPEKLEALLTDILLTSDVDPERAHGMEDDLYLNLLLWYAPSWVFQELLAARERVTRRWYA